MKHAALAVVAVGLSTVDPNRLLIGDLDGEGGRRGSVLGLRSHESREEALVQRFTGLRKARLCDRVVLS
jgi:hypothetical protein